ncbi:MAG: fused MFS/spermidine synthase [Pirellulales bacterium]
MAGYALTIFLSSFLLFQVQPLIGKYILPWFGGSPAVWTTCMLTFQVLLLGGYGYAHFLTDRVTPRRQGMVHLGLLVASLFFLPIVPSELWKPEGGESPTWRILTLLAVTIGAPYFMLSATAPLLQGWFARTNPGRSPYRLYALSNVGSLLALVSYPFVVEPSLALGRQASIWSWAYVVFAVLCGLCACRVFLRRDAMGTTAAAASGLDASADGETDGPALAAPNWATMAMWLSLAAFGSIMLLATTNQMCQDVAVIPFLWVVPLSLYLVTFIICFDNERWYRRGWSVPLLLVTVVAAAVAMGFGVNAPIWIQVSVYSAALFACCMVCHGELVRLKPHPRYLTVFYLAVAAGGALGGVFVTLVAPVMFKGYWEYPFALAGCCVLLLIAAFWDQAKAQGGASRSAWVTRLLIYSGVTAALCMAVASRMQPSIDKRRNFYGVLTVTEGSDKYNGKYYSLRHGRILHGYQYIDPAKRRYPTTYYGRQSGMGIALTQHPRRLSAKRDQRNLAIGVVGLGTGTTAALAEAGDLIRFYDINPDVIDLAKTRFTYLKDCPAKVDVVLGDARISMEREIREEKRPRYDVLVIDAFSSDAIPLHLLTRECFEIYWKRLKLDGILAVHISNRYLNLKPVVRGLAAAGHHQAVWVDSGNYPKLGVSRAEWVLVTSNRKFLDSKPVRAARKAWPEDDPEPLVWTDDFSNLFQVLTKSEYDITGSIKKLFRNPWAK